MYPKETIEYARELKENGLNLSQISRELGVSRSALMEWFSENKRYVRKNEQRADDDFFTLFNGSTTFRAAYYYLLGQYLGDGHISKNSRTLKLRIFATSKYTDIINEIRNAMLIVFPNNKVYLANKAGCKSVTINSNSMNIAFPQHGAGKKHTRKMELSEWQMKYFHENAKFLARGLFHSDGSYYYNRNNGGYWYYNFTNCSLDIHRIYQECLKCCDVSFTFNSKKVAENCSDAWVTVMSRKSEVEKAYAFLGTKS